MVVRWGRVLSGALAGALVVSGLTACGGDAAAGGVMRLRLGYLPNLTHATAIVGLEKGFFAHRLGGRVALRPVTFNAGPDAVQALFSGAVDAIYVGPNPTVNAWAKSRGQAATVVAGAASGGAALVVKPSIATPAQLRGTRIATPQLGNTQDVALRHWLKGQGLTATKEGGGDVAVVNQANAQTVDTFVTGAIDGAWVPEPYVSQLVGKGGTVLVDERDLWPDGKFVVTNLLVSRRFLAEHRDAVKGLLAGHVAANRFIDERPDQARAVVTGALGRLLGKPLDPAVTARAWRNLTFTDDPGAASLRTGARHAQELGLLPPVDLAGLHDLSLLDEVLREHGAPGTARRAARSA